MQYATRLWRKPLAECKPGELIHLPYGRSVALALVLEPLHSEPDDTDVPVAILRSPDEQSPHYDIWPKTHTCISFGTGWLLDPVISPDLSPGYMGEGSGFLEVSAEGDLVIVLQPGSHSRGFGSMRANLTTGKELPNHPNHAGAISKWSIWLSPEDRMVPDAKPFHTVRATLSR